MRRRSSIVLIEDNPADVRWFRLTLGQLGIDSELTVFSSGTAALEAFAHCAPPDLIVSDMFLPLLDGEELIDRIRLVHGFEKTPIAVCTGAREFLAHSSLPPFCRLVKPVDTEQLDRLLTEIQVRDSSR